MSLPPGKDLLKQFPNSWYVETGSWEGASIDLAYQAGFRRVIGIELNRDKWQHCINRFAGHHRMFLKMFNEDSANYLSEAMKYITVPATIFLDAHSQLFEDEEETANPFPLMKELEQLARHPVRNHTIIIDDILILTHPHVTGWTLLDIKSAVWTINPAYKIELIANPVKNNLLIATV